MEEGKRTRLIILLLAVLFGVGLASIPVLGIAAAPSGTITVCLAGPPQCDYQAIQAGINAAGAGDTVLVSAGTYSEQLALKSGVMVQSEHGPETVTVTASSQPVVSASGVVSVVIQGISVVGYRAVTPAVGIEITSSEVTISDCVIRNVHAANGDEAHHDGWDATAIQSVRSVLTLTESTIEDVAGGHGSYDWDYTSDGGDGFGVWADDGEVVISKTVIQHISGGIGGIADTTMVGVGEGGRAIGVHAEGGVNLVVDRSELVDLRGAEPRSAMGPWMCEIEAGAPTGVEAVGGTVVLRDNLFKDLWQQAAVGNDPSYAVRTSATLVTHLKGNVITFPRVELPRPPRPDAFSDAPLVPWGPIEGRSVIAIASEGDAVLRVVDNSLSNLLGVGENGEAIGIVAQDVGNVVLSGNSITGMTGGYSTDYGPQVTAVAIRLKRVSRAEIDANVIGGIHSEDVYPAAVICRGGGAFGIDLEEVQEAGVTNNAVWSLSGGNGSCFVPWMSSEKGGDAIALSVVSGTASVWNNVLYQTTAGIGGWDFDEELGSAVGLYLGQDADVLAVNNAIISHTIGVSATAHSVSILAYNALWDNGTDYADVSPGVGDLYVDPRFVDAESGDFHLRSSSPLIDAGTTVGAPSEDFEGETRPLDGNGDGFARVDIGVDEYWQGIVGSKKVQPAIAASGDVLTYQVVFSNLDFGHF